MLNFPEILILLSLDKIKGNFFPVPVKTLCLGMASAALFELSFRGLIDNDKSNIFIIKKSDLNESWLDELLIMLDNNKESLTINRALSLALLKSESIISSVINELVNKNILSKERLSSAKQSYNPIYKIKNDKTYNGIVNNIRRLVIEDDIPDPKDVVIINLLETVRLNRYIFSAKELKLYKKKIELIANLEFIGRESINIIRQLEKKSLKKTAEELLESKFDNISVKPGGISAVVSAVKELGNSAGLRKGMDIMRQVNQIGGFDCPACAWSNPLKNPYKFEFCENGIRCIASDMTGKIVDAEFFAKYSVEELKLQSDHYLENAGRLTQPMMLKPGESHYKPLSYEEAYRVIAENLKSLNSPDEAIFYTSGRTGCESAFLFQLLARRFGTNNLPGSANLCHEPSGVGMAKTLGFGKGSVMLDDFEHADAIFVFGHNPGSNHPRMLTSLMKAKQNGCRIVVINPIIEPSLVGFVNPHNFDLITEKINPIASLYIQPKINGDMALIQGIIKYLLEKSLLNPNILDNQFIEKYTEGFDEFSKNILNTDWNDIISSSGVDYETIAKAAEIYMFSDKTIVTWCLGITQHENSTNTIKEIVNLLLLKGNIGRKGAGICPVRGHSNVQGNRTVGIHKIITPKFNKALKDIFGFEAPSKPGLNAIDSIKAMYDGKANVFISLGGNLLSAAPDFNYTKKAMENCRLSVIISTKLNRNHLFSGESAIILPTLARHEKIIRNGIAQSVMIEDSMGIVSLSKGTMEPAASGIKSEVEIIVGIASELYGRGNLIPEEFTDNFYKIRELFPKFIDDFKEYDEDECRRKYFILPNPLRSRKFNTPSGKALFTINHIQRNMLKVSEITLMTIRSHEQFNTSVFGLSDRYKGIKNERKVVFMNYDDMDKMNLSAGESVDIKSCCGNDSKVLKNYTAVPHDIRQGCAAVYFPEANVLTDINSIDEVSGIPAYKSVPVIIVKKLLL